MKQKPVLVYTDLGRDVDDLEAITYIQGAPNLYVAGIVTTHMMPDRRAMIAREIMDNFGETNVPIGVGSVFPMEQEDEKLVRHLQEHSVNGKTYEGESIIECFPDGVDLILSLINEYESDLVIAALAPMTDLAKAAEKNRDLFSKVGGIYIQGQAEVKNSSGYQRLVPDSSAYNIKEDFIAAKKVFNLQSSIPLTILGKHAAYQAPLTRDDFKLFNSKNHPVGKYLQVHAEKGIECFAERAPDVFRRVFKVPANKNVKDAVAELEILSNPYDAVTVMAIDRPDLFQPETVRRHNLIGMTEDNPGVVNADTLKEHLINTMLTALRYSNN